MKMHTGISDGNVHEYWKAESSTPPASRGDSSLLGDARDPTLMNR
jgi:hypothetical protein